MYFLSPELEKMDLSAYMREALMEADLAGQAGEYPIGAVVVIEGKIISRGQASHNKFKSQLRHAELNALLDGGEPLWRDYKKAILFTTVEPCPLCLGAAVMADVPHIIFSLPDKVVHTEETIQTNPYINRHIRSYFGGVLEAETIKLMGKYNKELLQYTLTGKTK